MKLAIAQIVLGVLSVGALLGFSVWVEPGFYHVQLPAIEGSNVVTEVFSNPGRNIPMISWKGVSLVIGLSVLGFGIAQFVKAKGLKGAKPL